MRLFSICPRIRKTSGRIVASTAWRLRVMFLGAVYRTVAIDPTDETIAISSRSLWFTYGYEDILSAQYRLAVLHRH